MNTGAQRGANGKTSTPEVHHHGMVHGSDSVQTDELNTQLVSQPHELWVNSCELFIRVAQVDPLHSASKRVLEHCIYVTH